MDKKQKGIFFLSIIGSLIIGALFAIFVIPSLSKTIAGWGNNEILTVITVIGVIVALTVPFIESYLFKRQNEKGEKALYQIDIHITPLENNTVLFSASVENVGDKTIITKVSNLYIDQGLPVLKGSTIEVSGTEEIGAIYYDFPFILQHRRNIGGRPDCILCTKCRDEHDLNYPIDSIEDRFKNAKLYRAHIELEHLSDKSIQYIYPKERFSEDVILQFKNSGVYRVTFIVTTDGNADCECATKQFYIPEPLTQNNLQGGT